MKDDSAIEMFVGGLVLDPNTQAPVVVLKTEDGDVHLPIWIGVAEATSIASAIKELEMARPLTHDLMMSIVEEMSLRVERVVITELKESTYFAELILSSGDKALILDSRPSDAIAIALRASAPIFVSEQVLTQAQITFSQEGNVGSDGGSAEAGEGVGSEGSGEGGEGDLPDMEGEPIEEHPMEELSEEERKALEQRVALEEQEAEAEAANPMKNFTDIDKEKWNEILAELDPDDFKYKT
ncbi:bifunctional nuclease family protein [bacterium]|nr:bifunctional nuclease family protein [bacterium]